MMKKCSACGMAKDESCFASKNHYCRNCMAEMYKLKLKIKKIINKNNLLLKIPLAKRMRNEYETSE